MLDFLRIQFFLVNLFSLILLMFLIKKWHWINYSIIAELILGLCIHRKYLVNYTSLVAVEVPTAAALEDSEQVIRILLVNVQISHKTQRYGLI